MRGGHTPLHEQRKQSMHILLQGHNPPREQLAIGSPSRACLSVERFDPCGPDPLCGLLDIVRMNGPTEEARCGKCAQVVWIGSRGLTRIRCQNFQVLAVTEM